ncbi:30S ribosomal protein S3, partial [Candidatus Gottesmanbacteria bacterium]|nr:30S ribosomal protein S3 [Candidatus Gottesmanbacteria bacterium]
MGQKIHPKGFRIGGVFGWDSRWYASGASYSIFVLEDDKIRKSLLEKLHRAGITKVEIERSINKVNIILHVVRPGMVIGRGGQGMDEIKHYVTDLIHSHRQKFGRVEKKANLKLDLKVEPVKEPNLSAYFMASQIADQLAKRLNHKRVVNFALDKIMGSGAK